MRRFLNRAYHLLQRIIKEIKRFPITLSNFNFKIAVVTFFDGIIPPGKNKIYIKTIEEFVDVFTEELVCIYKKKEWEVREEQLEETKDIVPVWCCWWQGKEKMPELVQMCNHRLEKVIPKQKAKLFFITLENYKEYVALPDYIVTKFDTGKISMTEMSDILRVTLLSKFGGFWIDSTVFISGDFPVEFISKNYFVQRMYDEEKWKREACKGRWCGFLLSGSKSNLIFQYLRDAFYLWWKKYDCVIDYVIFDYFLLSAYKKIPQVKIMIDNVPDNNTNVFEMYKVLNEEYTKEMYDKLTKNTVFHKLTYKMELKKFTSDGKETLYGHLCEEVYSEGEVNE